MRLDQSQIIPRNAFGAPQDEDAGKRIADRVTLATIAGDGGRWMAFNLSDGTTKGTVYDTRRDAIRDQLHESQCCYVKIPRQNLMDTTEALVMLHAARKAYDAGLRFTDVD